MPRRLNFGCGYDKRDGYLNVDMDPACEPDLLIVDNDTSSIPRNWFEEVVAMDVLEHIPRTATPAVLLEWADFLVTGGRLRVETSSIDGVAAQIKRDTTFRGQYGWTHCLFGTQAQEGDFHLTGFTKTTLKVHLLAAGFDVDRIWVEHGWLLNAEATKTSSWSRVADESADLGDVEFVQAAYAAAFRRVPTEFERDHFLAELAAGRPRRDLLRHLMASPEHLFVTAAAIGLEREPQTPLAVRVRPYVPSAFVPPLRRLNTSARNAVLRGRRALGALNGRRSPSGA
jgi:predicted SAM-dependent methyltransferase